MTIATVIGRMNVSPAAPSGSSTVSAASGPYAAELSASSPKVGTPAAEPMRCSPASLEASGRPTIISISDIPAGSRGTAPGYLIGYAQRHQAAWQRQISNRFEFKDASHKPQRTSSAGVPPLGYDVRD